MPAPYKVSVLEDNGVELPYQTELLLSGSNTVFSPTSSATHRPANPATEVQTAINNSQANNNSLYLSAVNQITTASTSFVVDSAMTISPPAGTWAIWFTGDAETTGVNCQADYELFVDGVGIGESIRSAQNSTAILGLITLSTATVQCSIAMVTRYQFNGSQSLTFRYRVNPATAGAGNATMNQRTMLLMQVGI